MEPAAGLGPLPPVCARMEPAKACSMRTHRPESPCLGMMPWEGLRQDPPPPRHLAISPREARRRCRHSSLPSHRL